jgi:three-Cys-motif partner protein
LPNTEESFFDELKAWSEIKLRILVKYLEAYLHYRGRTNPRIYYIDGFAGTGRYGEDDPREGSPVLVAKLARRVAQEGRAYRLICINTELRTDRFGQLQECLAAFPPDVVRAYPGAFRDRLPEILKAIGSAPAVFFLDPFGPKAITLTDLLPLLQRADTELLLNLNSVSLRRMAGFEDSPQSGERAAKIRLVSQVLGADPADDRPEWLCRWLELKDGAAWEDWAADAYMNRLVQESPHLRFAARYPIREKFQAHPKYWLVFATRAIEAIVLMNDFVCTEEDDLFSKSRISPLGQESFLSLFDDANRDEQLARLVEDVYRFGLSQGTTTRNGVFQYFALQQWGQFKKAHYRQAVDRLVKSGRAKFTGERVTSNDKDTEWITFG